MRDSEDMSCLRGEIVGEFLVRVQYVCHCDAAETGVAVEEVECGFVGELVRCRVGVDEGLEADHGVDCVHEFLHVLVKAFC
jgi:hypothetical protein